MDRTQQACIMDIDLSIDDNTINPGELTVNVIRSSTRTIKACIYKLNHIGIYNELLKALERGVDISMIMDYKNNIHNALVRKLKYHGANIRLCKEDEKLHAKFSIFDEKRVLTGSYNWTQSKIHKIELVVDITHNIGEFIKLHHRLFESSKQF